MVVRETQNLALPGQATEAKGRWSITTHLLALATLAYVLSTSSSMMAPRVAQGSFWTSTLLVLPALILLWLAALWCSLRLRRPLRDFAGLAGEVMKGRLDARLPARRGPRELSQLSTECNRMMERLQAAEAELQAGNAKLEDRVAARTAELAAANRELEAFAYSVSHDLRAPVRLVYAFSGLLERESDRLSAEGQKNLESIRQEAGHMREMIDALLDLSRLARAPLAGTLVNLTSMAEQIAQSFRQSSPARQVRFVIQPGLQGFGDARLLRLVLQNLLGNAWKFTRQQSPAQIEFGATERKGEPVFFVRDNGVGFNMSGAHRLFNAFQRLHGSSEFEGVGVGLATVRRILERHGGRVWAEGEPGRGATFYFTLPAHPPGQPMAAGETKPLSGP